MAWKNISEVEELVNTFRETYKIDFSYKDFTKAFLSKVDSKTENVAEAQKKAFLEGVQNLYRDVIFNKHLRYEAIDGFQDFSPQLMEDCYNIVNAYSQTKEGSSYFKTGFEFEMENTEQIRAIYEGVKDLGNNYGKSTIDWCKTLYQEGKLRIRDMRTYANNLKPKEMSMDNIAVALQYSQSLKEINEGRSFWWRLFHPFRNNAEQRDAQTIETIVKNKIIEMHQDSQSNYIIGDENDILNNYRYHARTHTPFGEAVSYIAEEVRAEMDENESVFSEEEEIENRPQQQNANEQVNEQENIIEDDNVSEMSEEESLEESLIFDEKEREKIVINFEDGENKKIAPFIEGKEMDSPILNNSK